MNTLTTPRIGLGPSLVRFLLCVALVAMVSGAGGAITASQIPAWYAGLVKPAWTPPNLAFPVVWTTLYGLMALCLWRLWDRAPVGEARRRALILFLVQLALNGIWTPIFFGLHAVGVALAVLVALIVAVALTMRAAFAADEVAGWLLIPYLPWLLYAASLNGAILYLN